MHDFVELIGQTTPEVQRRMVWHFFMAEAELGQRVGDGLGIGADDVRGLPPLATQRLSEQEQERLENRVIPAQAGGGTDDVVGPAATLIALPVHLTAGPA